MTRVSLTGTSDAPNAQRVRSHCPDLLEKLNVFYEGIWVSKRVEPAIKELIRMRCATVNTCSY
ncbi:MAG: hypothetical protein HOI95_19550 [Chromatiales bacterium]|jgi:hypothetical protein|nr:hypothetical protein [Chromatiales bacterium]